MSALKKALESLLIERDPQKSLQNDPLSFVHRYEKQYDQEIAAVFAAQLAYGRVASFFPIIEKILDEADHFGGPRAWVNAFSNAHSQRIEHIYYRLNKSPDFALLAVGLQGVCSEYSSLFSCFQQGYSTDHDNINTALDAFVANISRHAQKRASSIGWKQSTLPRSFRHMLSRPASGSACKRWNLFLRWMIRVEFPDLGIWDIPSQKLIIPLDTHVHQISLMLGLCSQKSANNKTARAITESLRKLDEKDPIRYDFAIAHLGISGSCQKKYVSSICTSCPLQTVCTVEKRI
ncbi:MAG: TIGR02757 family protein [Deltaproteobacteria bacterium]|nr:TIGR02757 family protein [Deltaproteobacteria bacterium]